MGVTEKDRENIWNLVQDSLKSSINVGLDDGEIVASNRKPRPIIANVANTNIKVLYKENARDQPKMKWIETGG